MDERPTTTAPNHHAHYPAFAGVSGGLAALTMLRGRRPMARLAADLVDLQPDDQLVDIGCGPGAAVRFAARGGVAATGVDPAGVMLAVARLVPTRRRAQWVTGRAEALPRPDRSATVVWSLSAVHHWADIGGGLAEARRVLRPGGRLLAVEGRIDPGSNGLASHGWTEAQAATFGADCRAAGFDAVVVSDHVVEGRTVLAVVARRP